MPEMMRETVPLLAFAGGKQELLSLSQKYSFLILPFFSLVGILIIKAIQFT